MGNLQGKRSPSFHELHSDSQLCVLIWMENLQLQCQLKRFTAEIQVIRPVLNAFFKGDTEVLKKYCSKEEIERCKAEHQAFDSQGIIFDNKILHVSDIEVREKKMMGDSPLIILGFKTQQVYCIRDKLGSIKEGGKDTIHIVHYAWAMQLGEDRVWRLREMQQFGVAALI
ncbi:mitochondrial import inner membrane translocase subunit TIM44-2-like isoform X3 [Nicotiana sylvestris]|uniref:mitochondrial import inner membrane translocase subunit TIM44-2-like isoform X3 n=1 Tax=Nicotiana sylvestris TaxID=4096 RepID=UPI00388C98E7